MSGVAHSSLLNEPVESLPIGDALEKYLDELDRLLKLDSKLPPPERTTRAWELSVNSRKARQSLERARGELFAYKGDYIQFDSGELDNMFDFVGFMAKVQKYFSQSSLYEERREDPPEWLNTQVDDWQAWVVDGTRKRVTPPGRDLNSTVSQLFSQAWAATIIPLVPIESLPNLAATTIFRKDPGYVWSDALEALSTTGRQCSEIDIEEECGGEYVKTMIAMSADFVATRTHVRPDHFPNTYDDNNEEETDEILLRRLQPIRLSDLLSMLLGENQGFEHAKDYWVNFTHYLHLPAPYSHSHISLLALGLVAEAYTRQAALLGPRTQGGYDALYPCYFHAGSRPPIGEVPLNRTRLSFFAVQVKHRVEPRSPFWPENYSRCKVQAVDDRLRVFQLCAELGLSTAAVQVDSQDAGLLKLRACGLDEKTFPVLSQLRGPAVCKFKQLVMKEDR